ASGGGSVVNIGSVAGVQSSGAVGYGTAKGAVLPLTRDMAMALGRDGIRVNCVIPGHLHTPHVEGVGGPNARQIRNGLNML
ncbi:SDR family oxidoreductase, partial [Escherichia coli]